ncbi:MAG: thioredoxin family protein [Oligoflexales bacterium]
MLLLKNLRHYISWLSLVSLFSLPVLGKEKQLTKPSFESLWFKGSVEEAFEQSKKLDKPVFLYWGATWCPPCNELKSQVFAKQKFKDLITSVIPVYLEGDTDAAQKWGEKLKISGYPTLLVLDPKHQELLRIAESLNIDEFEQAFLAATALRKPIKEIINDALTQEASTKVWQALAYTHWEQMGGEIFDDEHLLQVSVNLHAKVPTRLVEVRSVMAAKILKLAARISQTKGQTPNTQSLLKQIAKNAINLYTQIFHTTSTVLAARTTILNKTRTILTWSARHLNKTQLEDVYSKWENAAKIIGKDSDTSIDSKLWASYVPLSLYRLRTETSAPLPAYMVTSIKNAVKKADQQAKTAFERKSVISGAAYLLRKIEAYPEAKALLEKELKTSKTPWYIQSSLSRLAEVQGKHQLALAWSAKARESAKGNATKIQWTVSDLLLTIKLQPSNIGQIEKLLEEYYGLAFSLTDGFLGRNQVRANKVLRGIKSLPSNEKISAISLKNQKKCSQLKAKNSESCEQYFKHLDEASKTI